MPYILPTFNLSCNIYTGGVPAPMPRLTSACQLRFPRLRTAFTVYQVPVDQLVIITYLLVPARTDIRDPQTASGADLIECPAGSGRYYLAAFVDDIAKGFTNEHRLVAMVKPQIGFLTWPTPIP